MEIKFRWVGLNKHFNEIQIQEDLTTEKIMNGENLTFFSNYNRGESGNCKFLSEDLHSGLDNLYNGDIVKCTAYTNEGMTNFSFDTDLKIFSIEELKGKKEFDFVSELKYEDGEFYVQENSGTFIPLSCFFGDPRTGQPMCFIEKIGDKYQNPELIQVSEGEKNFFV